MTFTMTSRSGRVTVGASGEGLPAVVHIDPAGLRSDPHAMAAEIVQICRRARLQGQVDQRVELSVAGVPEDVLATMGLASADELAAAELADDIEAADGAMWRRRR